MRTPFDQFAKQVLEQALEGCGRGETDAEVAGEGQRVDVRFAPGPTLARPPGLLGRLAEAPCLFEPFHQPPDLGEVLSCVRKQLGLHRAAVQEAEKAAQLAPERPMPLWVLSGGRPNRALSELKLRHPPGWPRGVYFGPPGLPVRIVVLSALPRTRDTLLARLLGAGRTLLGAVEDLEHLPSDAWEREVAKGPLVQLRLVRPKAVGAAEEQVMARLELYEKWKAETEATGQARGLAQGVEQGTLEGLRAGIAAAYQARFGPLPAGLRAALETVADPERLTRWVALAATVTAEEFARQVQGELKA